MTPRQRHLFTLAFLGFFPVIFSFLFVEEWRLRYSIAASGLVSYLGFLATQWLVPFVAASNLKAGLYGIDINKPGTKSDDKRIPESLGLAVGVVYLLCLILFEYLHVYDATGSQYFATESDLIEWIVDYNAAMATICFMLFLGFADDVLDIRWSVKMVLPGIAALPLLVSYSGGTGILIPKPLRPWLGAFLELGVLYKIYMVLLTIFCANSINILAGVNGLEAGQTFLIACGISVHNLIEIVGNAASNTTVQNGHLFSLFLMLPLATTTFALLGFNWFPAQVFVGDTFTNFAGMCIAVAGILGHFSETLLIFLIPQLINFCYSLPQILPIIPCPKHRLPRYEPSDGQLYAVPQWNLINLILYVMGPCPEEWLCIRVLVIQYMSCCFAFLLRWYLHGWYK